MKWLVAVVVIAAAVAAWWWWHRSQAVAPPHTLPPPPAKVVHIGNAEDRKRIAEAIAMAAAGRKAETPPRPALPPTGPQDLLHTLGEVLGEQVHDQLTDCVKKSPGITGFKATLALASDPDVGTLIDEKAITGSDGRALPKPFQDCVNDVLFDLELPPLAVGEHYNVDVDFDFKW